jgi:hypothetical protein
MMFFVCQTFLVVFPKYFIFGVACNLSSPVPIRSTPAHLFGKNQDLSAYSDPSLAGFILRHIFLCGVLYDPTTGETVYIPVGTRIYVEARDPRYQEVV